MIEFIDADRCTGCGDCIAVCPAMVLDATPAGRPIVARQEDCQTCLACELHCQADAILVAPQMAPLAAGVTAAMRAGMGAYRRQSGWHEFAGDPRYANEHWRMDEIFAAARALPED